MVYTLPTDDKSRFFIREGRLNFTADDAFGSNETGDKHPIYQEKGVPNQYDPEHGYQYWDDYNVTVDKSYKPLRITWKVNKDEQNSDYNTARRQFAQSLVSNK